MTPPSIKDVARLAEVSIGTVSNVLNRPDVVRPATRERVERAITRLGFVRNESARQLRAGVSRTVAFVVLDTANPFFTDIARGMDDLARERGRIVYLCDTNFDPGREDEIVAQLLEQRVLGVCIVPNNLESPKLQELKRAGVPVILVDQASSKGELPWCSVGVDDVLGGGLAATHLIERGHERIAFVGVTKPVTQSRSRLVGVQQAAKKHGAISITTLDSTAMTVREGRRALERLLAIPADERPTAMFCGNDLLALGALQGAIANDLKVPRDLALVGYDDIDFAAGTSVPLTTVAQPRHEIGRMALQLLEDEVAEGEEHVHRQVRYTPELVVRASSG